MAIGNAVQQGMSVQVYDEKNRWIFAKAVGSGPNDGLKGYTSGTVNIQMGNTIFSYNEKGQSVGTRSAI
ncbi:MAG: hypothetical protein KKF58_01735 [Gammaproteobacteria bacterium]|nr:hypothetical protein [Gammaproteobacteria bacterium]